MPQEARIGDPSSHGGIIISGSDDVRADGISKARLGDMHSCPLLGHGVTPLVTASNDVYTDARGQVRVGDSAGCGAVIVDGSPDVYAD